MLHISDLFSHPLSLPNRELRQPAMLLELSSGVSQADDSVCYEVITDYCTSIQHYLGKAEVALPLTWGVYVGLWGWRRKMKRKIWTWGSVGRFQQIYHRKMQPERLVTGFA